MKIYVGVIAYNEEWIIEASLRSIYDYVDEIVVIDGSLWGASTDKTVEIARSIGSKVKVTSGKWKNTGTDHKMVQRSAYLNRMPRDSNSWCILHDADEVWDGGNLERLIGYMRRADKKTMLFSYQWLHLFGDCWHSIHGGSWSRVRRVGTFRLIPGVKQLNHHMVGLRGKKNFQKLGSPGHIILWDVMFHHYGHACSLEKAKFKSRYYFIRDGKFRQGCETWEQYEKRFFMPGWNSRMQQPQVKLYNGPHPEAIQPMIGTFWKK